MVSAGVRSSGVAFTEQAGRKTWVQLDEPLSTEVVRAVVDETRWKTQRERLATNIASSNE
jgi:hypothetical protein